MPPRALYAHAVGAYRPDDVLDLLLASIVQRQPYLALEVVIGGAGDQYAAGFAKLLETGGDIDAVAEQVCAVHHDVAEIDSHPEHDAALSRAARLHRGDLLLGCDRTVDCVDDGTELCNGAVAHQLDDAAMVFDKQRLDHLGAQFPDRAQGARLVLLDESGITNDVGSENRR